MKIDFSKPKKGLEQPRDSDKRSLESSMDDDELNTECVGHKKARISEPTEAEQSMFLQSLKVLAPKAAVVSATFKTEEGSSAIVSNSLPPTMISLFKPHYKNMSEHSLLEECQTVFDSLTVTPTESNYLFESTRLQSQSSIWYLHRAGRLTASNFGTICKTSATNPSKSLIKRILGIGSKVQSEAMRWGCEHEAIALEAYRKKLETVHLQFEVESSGLLVNPLAPHLGASADGFVSCECCGLGVLEIKCPFSIRNTPPTDAPYLEKVDDSFRLLKNHNYFYQVQGQMLISERLYCDFVCWTTVGIHVERIQYNNEMAMGMVTMLDKFFINVILPKILCGYESGEKPAQSSIDNQVFCICRRAESGMMIECDNPCCEIGWYHYSCLKLPNDYEPGEEWLCPQCEKNRHHLD